jgi:hypothetical protein
MVVVLIEINVSVVTLDVGVRARVGGSSSPVRTEVG